MLDPPLSELEKGDIKTLLKEFVETIDVQNKANIEWIHSEMRM